MVLGWFGFALLIIVTIGLLVMYVLQGSFSILPTIATLDIRKTSANNALGSYLEISSIKSWTMRIDYFDIRHETTRVQHMFMYLAKRKGGLKKKKLLIDTEFQDEASDGMS